MQNSSLNQEPSAGQWRQAVIELTNLIVKHLRTYAAPLLFVLTTIGVCFVLYCAIKVRSKLRGSHLLLCAITVADFFTVFLSVLLGDFLADGLKSHLPQLSMPHHLSSWACKLWSFFWILSNSVSSNILCLMAADRVYALSWPLHHRARMTKRRYAVAIGAFVLAFAVVSAHGIVLYDAYEYYGSRYCYVVLSVSPAVGLAVQLYTNLVMNGFLSGIALAIGNVFICWRLWCIRKNPVRYGPGGGNDRPSKGQVRTSLTLIILAAFYLIASVPRAVIYFIIFLLNNRLMDSDAGLLPLVFALAKCLNYLFYLNCALNWVIYCARVPLFKKQLKSSQDSSSS